MGSQPGPLRSDGLRGSFHPRDTLSSFSAHLCGCQHPLTALITHPCSRHCDPPTPCPPSVNSPPSNLGPLGTSPPADRTLSRGSGAKLFPWVPSASRRWHRRLRPGQGCIWWSRAGHTPSGSEILHKLLCSPDVCGLEAPWGVQLAPRTEWDSASSTLAR